MDKWIEIAKECKYLPENDLKVIFYELDCWNLLINLKMSMYWSSHPWFLVGFVLLDI
jgi:hypothetical protein